MNELVLDVSDNNAHPLPWDQFVAVGVKGIVVKLTELLPNGTHYVNQFAASDIAEASARGIGVACYFFFHASQSAAEQITLVQEHYPPGLALLFQDVESDGFDGLSETQVGELAEACLKAFPTGYPIVGPYLNLSEIATMTGAPWGLPLWLADPSHPATPSVACLLHQYGTETFNGVIIDVNHFLGTDEQFTTLFPVLAAPAPTPDPTPPPAPPEPPAPAPQPPEADVNPPAPLIKQGATGQAVKAAQNLIGMWGFHIAVDGVFGPITAGAVKAAQAKFGIAQDSIVGPDTWGHLISG